MKISAFTIALFGLLIALPASAETFYLKDHPGWEASGNPDGQLSFRRQDLPITDLSITAYQAQPGSVTSQEDAIRRIEGIVDDVVKSYPARCSALIGAQAKPNGMGFEIKNDEDNPTCFLFVSLTPEQRMFANLWIDSGELERESLAYQKTAALWLYLAMKRIQGEPVVPTDDEPANLKMIAERVVADHSPAQMLHMQRTIDPPKHVALPVYEGKPLTNCANWDPSFYTAAELLVAGGSDQIHISLEPCSIFAWKNNFKSGAIEVYVAGDWRTLANFGQHIGYDNVTGARVEPFAPGETINFLGGDKNRLFAHTKNADIRSLHSGDIWFTPDGRFTAGRLGLENTPLTLPVGSDGRYYFHEHIAVFERDDGPILIALAGKIIEDGKISRIFIGGNSYELSDEYRDLLRD